MALTKKQQAFVNAYVKHWNASRAAREAGYSKAYAHTNTGKLLKNTNISEAIEEKVTEMTMSADQALVELAEVAKPPVSHFDFFVTEKATVINDEGEAEVIRTEIDADMVREYGHLIKSISFTSAGPKIEFYSRMDALQLIGKHHGLFTDKHDITSGGKEIHTFTIDDMMKARSDLSDWEKNDTD